MKAHHDHAPPDDRIVALRRQAWDEARRQVEHECWMSIHYKANNAVGMWRDCPLATCKRARRCGDERMPCRRVWLSRSQLPEMTAEERAQLTYQVKQELERQRAAADARGEVNDTEDRIARLAEQKLRAMGITSAGDR